MAILSRTEIANPGFAQTLLDTITKVSATWSDTKEGKIYTGLELHRLATIAAMNNLGSFLVDQLGEKKIQILQNQSLEFEITLDNNFMDKAMRGEVQNLSEHPLQILYDLLAKREYDMVQRYINKKPTQPWIHIGSGYPETAIGLYNQFKIPVICVDKDSKVVNEVKPVLKKFGLWGKDKLTVVHEDGKAIIPSAQVVIISAMVPNEDKEAIIDNMRKLSFGDNDEPLLILRTPPDRSFSILYPSLFNEADIQEWKLKKVGDTKEQLTPGEFLRSMLYRVIETADVRRGFDRIPLEAEKRLRPLSFDQA